MISFLLPCVCRALLTSLTDREFNFEDCILVVIDGPTILVSSSSSSAADVEAHPGFVQGSRNLPCSSGRCNLVGQNHSNYRGLGRAYVS